jgi:hypothetical protein
MRLCVEDAYRSASQRWVEGRLDAWAGPVRCIGGASTRVAYNTFPVWTLHAERSLPPGGLPRVFPAGEQIHLRVRE